MKRVLLIRTIDHPQATLGVLFILDALGKQLFQCATLELPWRDNQTGISRIPNGTYPMEYEHSPGFKRYLWELKEVPGRSEVKIHTANYARQLRGCIALGAKHKDIDGDQIPDVTSSSVTLAEFHRILADQQAFRTPITIMEAKDLT